MEVWNSEGHLRLFRDVENLAVAICGIEILYTWIVSLYDHIWYEEDFEAANMESGFDERNSIYKIGSIHVKIRKSELCQSVITSETYV